MAFCCSSRALLDRRAISSGVGLADVAPHEHAQASAKKTAFADNV